MFNYVDELKRLSCIWCDSYVQLYGCVSCPNKSSHIINYAIRKLALTNINIYKDIHEQKKHIKLYAILWQRTFDDSPFSSVTHRSLIVTTKEINRQAVKYMNKFN